jgi:hypothetical protein
VAVLDVREEKARRRLASRELTSEDFAGGTGYQPVPLMFELTEPTSVEVRVRFASEADVWIDRIEIQDRGM